MWRDIAVMTILLLIVFLLSSHFSRGSRLFLYDEGMMWY